jgi:hypothetical protein
VILSFQRRQTVRSKDINVALGWEMIRFDADDRHYWYVHEGGSGGYRSSVFMDPDNKIAAIVLSNVSVYHPNSKNIGKLGYELLKRLYISQKINGTGSGEAPFLEIALKKGWGTKLNDGISRIKKPDNSLVGVWQKRSSNRVITYTFKPDKKVQCDFVGDPEIDVWGVYHLDNSKVQFREIGGAACDSVGVYGYSINGDTLKWVLKNDPCEGRRNGLPGIWIRKK